jgi:hypothetical protein
MQTENKKGRTSEDLDASCDAIEIEGKDQEMVENCED